jgi:hypothetical protein
MKWATDSERTHGNIIKANQALDLADRFHYRRLNVEVGLDTMKLDKWRARHPLRTKLGVIIGKMKSRKAKESGAEAREGQSAEEKGTCSQNGNGRSEDEVPPDGHNALEQAQRGSHVPGSGQANATSVNESEEKGDNIPCGRRYNRLIDHQ